MAEADPEHWIVIDARDDPDSVQLHIWCQLKDRLAIA
jgi:thymidylate kinase